MRSVPRRVDEVLTLVGLAARGASAVATLSGGEQQRVALARALAVAPRLMMLDEPLGALDRQWRARLLDEIRTLLADADLPAVYVTHDHDEAFAVASRIAVMREGRIVQHGAPGDVWRRPIDAWTASFLGFGPATPCRARARALETPWGVWPVSARVADGPCLVVLRPDAVALVGEGSGVISGTVVGTTFTGAVVTVLVQPEHGDALAVAVPQHRAPAAGATVHLTVDADGVLVYPAD